MAAARLAFLLTFTAVGLNTTTVHAIEWPSLRLFSSDARPGTPDWWAKHKGEAIHEPGKGYRVPGFEGYFDGEGRAMQAPVDEVVAAMRARENAPGGLFPNLDPKRNIERVKTAVNGGPNQQAAKKLFEDARAQYTQQQYARAASTFESAAERFPGSKIAEEALFYAAESYFRDDRYVQARDGYNQLVSDYPNTRHLDELIDRQWKIAQYWENYHFKYDANPTLQPNFFDKTRPTFDTVGQAIKTYDSIRLNDPTGPRADDAIMATASIHFRLKRFDDADYHYTLLREDYPRSDKQFEAHLLGLQSKLRMYQGPDYDGTALEDAKKLAKRIRTNFAGRLTPAEKERLRAVDAQVQLEVEQRDLRMAQYYDKIQQYGAARQIYAEIARKYSGSPIAEQSATRLAQLGGLPAVPEKPMARFVALVPQNRERAKFSNIPEVQANTARLAANTNGAGAVDVTVKATEAGSVQR